MKRSNGILALSFLFLAAPAFAQEAPKEANPATLAPKKEEARIRANDVLQAGLQKLREYANVGTENVFDNAMGGFNPLDDHANSQFVTISQAKCMNLQLNEVAKAFPKNQSARLGLLYITLFIGTHDEWTSHKKETGMQRIFGSEGVLGINPGMLDGKCEFVSREEMLKEFNKNKKIVADEKKAEAPDLKIVLDDLDRLFKSKTRLPADTAQAGQSTKTVTIDGKVYHLVPVQKTDTTGVQRQ